MQKVTEISLDLVLLQMTTGARDCLRFALLMDFGEGQEEKGTSDGLEGFYLSNCKSMWTDKVVNYKENYQRKKTDHVLFNILFTGRIEILDQE